MGLFNQGIPLYESMDVLAAPRAVPRKVTTPRHCRYCKREMQIGERLWLREIAGCKLRYCSDDHAEEHEIALLKRIDYFDGIVDDDAEFSKRIAEEFESEDIEESLHEAEIREECPQYFGDDRSDPDDDNDVEEDPWVRHEAARTPREPGQE